MQPGRGFVPFPDTARSRALRYRSLLAMQRLVLIIIITPFSLTILRGLLLGTLATPLAVSSSSSVVSHNSVYITSIFAVVCCPCRDLYVHSILVRNSGAHCASSS